MSILTALNKKYLQVGEIVRSMPYVLVFKTTNYCWYKCPHCCESSGPDQPKVYMPADVIEGYLAQAKADPLFGNEVVFTGGEIMSAYRFGPENYVPWLLNSALNKQIGVDIKTNGAWAKTTFGKTIFSDLETVVRNHAPYAMQLSLSLDKYHKNSIENTYLIISALARKKLKLQINISSFAGQEDMFNTVLDQLKKSGVPVYNGHIFTNTGNIYDRIVANNSILIEYSTASVFAHGRAKNLPEAQDTQFPQFSFMAPPNLILTAFDTFGRTTLGENSGHKISAAWRQPNGIARPLADIRHDLVRHAQYEEIRARLLFGWRPVSR